MRHGLYGGTALLTAAIFMASPSMVQAQSSALDTLVGPADVVARGQIDTTYAISPEPSEKLPLPLGNPGTHGFYTIAEFMYLTTNRTIGDQTVAYRGLVDSTGAITSLPGIYIGSGVEALNTREFGKSSYMPGYKLGLGYKTDDGIAISFEYIMLADRNYSVAATSATPFARSRQDLSDTFLVAGVFNFPPQYAGPAQKTRVEQTLGGNVFYGIWNGATDMVIQFNQRFQQGEIGARVPLYQTEYSRIYGLAGGRFDWFFERFKWRTQSYDVSGATGPAFVANYTNTLSQRLYGPYVGCGHEVYLGKRFSLSSDVTGAALVNLAKMRAKYKLGDESIQNKSSKDDYTLVPSFTGNLNLWWYPFEGVQLRAGYNAWTFFNTKNMLNPIGFNYGNIDAPYNTQYFRIVHGLNFGIGLFF